MPNIEPQITSNCPSCATPKKREKGKLKLWTLDLLPCDPVRERVKHFRIYAMLNSLQDFKAAPVPEAQYHPDTPVRSANSRLSVNGRFPT